MFAQAKIPEQEIILRQINGFGQHRIVCPFCSHTRKSSHQKERCMSVKRDEIGVTYNCQHCGETGSIMDRRQGNVVQIEKPIARKDVSETSALSQEHLSWLLNERGISKGTAEAYGLYSEETFFPSAGERHPAVAFPYFDKNGKIVSAKIRSIKGKAFTCWQSPPSFFGVQKMKPGDDFVIVEGEIDALAMAEAGIKAVSVPNGAPVKVVDGKISPEEDTKFKFLWAAKDLLDKAKRVVIAVDSDGPGSALAEEIARRVGRDKCWRVNWPEGIKDADQCLIEKGKDVLVDVVKKAEPWPVEGIYDASHFKDQIVDLYDNGMGKGASTGYDNVDALYTIVPGQMTVVTGVPSSGKSEFIDQIMINLAANLGWSFGVCSFENEPRLHIAKLLSKRVGKPFFDGKTERMSRTDLEAGMSWIGDHFTFLFQEDGGLADLDSILERLRVAVLRYGIRGAVIDPYNFIERPRDISETESISNMLTRIKAFAMAHGIHVWFVAHPTKLQKGLDGKLPVPKGYDISGSAAWFAKADCGLTVHRVPEVNKLEAQIHIWKCRFSWVGQQGETKLYYDIGTTRYNDYSPPPSEEEVKFFGQ